MTTNVIVIGALGKMGREIVACVLIRRGKAAAAWNKRGTLKRDAISAMHRTRQGGNQVTNVPCRFQLKTSVVIDFTSSKSRWLCANNLRSRKTAIVIGTTGLSDTDIEKSGNWPSFVRLFLSPNMSLGVNLLFHLTRIVASRLKDDFDIEIIEAHHRF